MKAVEPFGRVRLDEEYLGKKREGQSDPLRRGINAGIPDHGGRRVYFGKHESIHASLGKGSKDEEPGLKRLTEVVWYQAI